MGLLDRLGWRRVAPPRLDPSDRRILLVHLDDGLGAGLLLAPVVKALLDAGARPPVGLILRERAARAWKHVDLPVRVHLLPEALSRSPEPDDEEAQAEILRLGVALRRRGYAVAADLTLDEETDGQVWLHRSEAPIRLGRVGPRADGRDELTWACPEGRGSDRHRSWSLAEPLAPFQLRELPREVPFTCSSTARTKAASLWTPSPGAPRVVVLPGGRDPSEGLDPTLFVTVARRARARGASVVIAGGPAEAKRIRAVAREVNGAATYAGKALGPLVAAIVDSDVVVTPDIGPMHLAYLSGRATIALFARRSPVIWGPPRSEPRFATFIVPPGLPSEALPVIERRVIERLDAHLGGLGSPES